MSKRGKWGHKIKPHCSAFFKVPCGTGELQRRGLCGSLTTKRIWVEAWDKALIGFVMVILHHIWLLSAPRCGLIHPALTLAAWKITSLGLFCESEEGQKRCFRSLYTKAYLCEPGMGKNSAAPENVHLCGFQMSFWILKSQTWDFCPSLLFFPSFINKCNFSYLIRIILEGLHLTRNSHLYLLSVLYHPSLAQIYSLKATCKEMIASMN